MAETIEQKAGYTAVLYPRVQELIEAGAQLVEVLPEEDYEELHLPAAISLPLKRLDEARVNRTRLVSSRSCAAPWRRRRASIKR